MKEMRLPFTSGLIPVILPDQTDVFRMRESEFLKDPQQAVVAALEHPISSEPLKEIVRRKRREDSSAKAVIVVSDNTRPVPYSGEDGILWPIIEVLFDEGLAASEILILVATGTHRAMDDDELRKMLDQRVFLHDIPIINHDCKDLEHLQALGRTSRGTDVQIDSWYMDCSIRILTGLVESHFMAGASGGRKSICPGLVGEGSTFIFHGAKMLGDPRSCDLNLAGNPCHEEALEVAQKAGADFIVNVTLDGDFRITGVYAGDLLKAHEAAVEQVKQHVGIPFSEEYDVVITHAGFVGINHYQVAKSGHAAMSMVKENGYVIIAADTTDTRHAVGAKTYRTVLQLLDVVGRERFLRLINSPDWQFIPEQWQVQMWCRLFGKIPMDHLYFFSPQFEKEHYLMCVGVDGSKFAAGDEPVERIASFYQGALEDAAKRLGRSVEDLSICVLEDGPYGIPLKRENQS